MISHSLEVQILERPEAEPYGNFFRECPHALAQQSLQWSDIIAPISPDKPYFLIAYEKNNRSIIGGLPLFYFETRLGGILTSVPHAGPLGGVLCRQELEALQRKRVYCDLMKAAINMAEKEKCISLSIITNPFLGDADFYSEPARPAYILKNFCQVTDLKTVFDDSGDYNTGKSSHNNHIRRNLSKAEQAGVEIQWAEENEFEEWYALHCSRHREIGAVPLPKSLLQGILSILKPADMGGLVLARINDHLVGGCMYIWNQEVVDAYMPSIDTGFLKFGVNHAITDYALRYFLRKGFRWFNWQSCRRNSGVYLYKKRWGSQEWHYQFLTWIFPGFEKIFEEEVGEASKAFQWHYLAPFDAIKRGLLQGIFEKSE